MWYGYEKQLFDYIYSYNELECKLNANEQG